MLPDSGPSPGAPDKVWLRHPLDIDAVAPQVDRAMALIGGAARLPALRWYWAQAPTLILGVFQPAEMVNLAACAARGIPVVRRRSGGTGVLAGPPLLSLDIGLPPDHPLALPDVTESYRWLGEAWLRTLADMGLRRARLVPVAEVRAAPAARPLRALPPDRDLSDDELAQLACYGTLSPYEVAIGSRKLVGLAQVRRRGGALLQVGLPLTWQADLLAELLALRPTDRARLAGILCARAIGLDEALPGAPPASVIMAAFEATLAAEWGIRLEDSPAAVSLTRP